MDFKILEDLSGMLSEQQDVEAHVSVSFLGLQRMQAKTNRIRVPLTNTARVSDILEYVRACYPDLVFSEGEFLITVNNQASGMDVILRDNDNISFIPCLGGG